MMSTTAAVPQSASTKAREAFFLEFAHAVREHLPGVALMVTGGFRSRAGMEAALASNGCDLIGLGRPSVMKPFMPQEVLLNKAVQDKDAVIAVHRVNSSVLVKLTGIKSVGAGAETVSSD